MNLPDTRLELTLILRAGEGKIPNDGTAFKATADVSVTGQMYGMAFENCVFNYDERNYTWTH